MRRVLVALFVSLCSPAPATAQIGISIGIDLPAFPQLVVVPGYPVYYAPALDSNLFFYDGLYWVYAQDGWYASSWYNGPWTPMGPDDVPLYVLRVPVRYYRQPPAYFRAWEPDAPPRWGQRWGGDWERRHGGWDRWNRQGTPRPAPLPVYQKEYARDSYPPADRQRSLHDQLYRHQSRDPAVLRARHAQGPPGAAPAAPRGTAAPPATAPERRGASRPQAKAPERGERASGGGGAPERRDGGEPPGRAKGRQARPEEQAGQRQPKADEHHTER
jgi:hypothetical protein